MDLCQTFIRIKKQNFSLNRILRVIQYGLHFRESCFSTLLTKYSNKIISFRYCVSFENIAGESKSVTAETTALWTETYLLTILSNLKRCKLQHR